MGVVSDHIGLTLPDGESLTLPDGEKGQHVSDRVEFEVTRDIPVYAEDGTTGIGQVRPHTRYQAAGTDGAG